jgi:hypothetical protein
MAQTTSTATTTTPSALKTVGTWSKTPAGKWGVSIKVKCAAGCATLVGRFCRVQRKDGTMSCETLGALVEDIVDGDGCATPSDRDARPMVTSAELHARLRADVDLLDTLRSALDAVAPEAGGDTLEALRTLIVRADGAPSRSTPDTDTVRPPAVKEK